MTRFKRSASLLAVMKIGIVGATGSFGKGLVYRWAKKHTIYIGSRSQEKGEQKAKDYRLELQKYGIDARLVGTSNYDAITNGDVIVLSVQFEHLMPLITDFRDKFRNRIVISPIVSLKKGNVFNIYRLQRGVLPFLFKKCFRILPSFQHFTLFRPIDYRDQI